MRQLLAQQQRLFLLALSFFTRIPVNLSDDIKPEMLHQSSRYFALVGLIVGIVCAGSYVLFSLFLPTEIAILLMMGVSLLLTGAFHEDGWADVWDGFGGGWTVEQKLTIMKDSRLGTYGAAALFVILMLKYQSLLLLASPLMTLSMPISTPLLTPIVALILGHTLSRALAASLIYSMNYVQEDQLTKVKPLANQMSKTSLLVLLTTSLAVLLGSVLVSEITLSTVFFLIVFLLGVRAVLIFWFNRQLNGYTGDCLGAAQQISEVSIYLFLISILGVSL